MPEPISSSNSSSSQIPLDPTLDETGQVCRAPLPNSSQPGPVSSEPPSQPQAIGKLLSAVRPPPAALPPASTSTHPSEAQNNAQRTTELKGVVQGYVDYGITGDAADAAYVGVAALKGRDPKTGIELEVFSASAQVGGENEAQAGMARVGLSGKNGSVTAELFTARANGGAHNDDGSLGINSGAVVNFANLEGTLSHGSDSITFGFGAGAGAAVSVGLRDIDNNGTVEKCIKGTIGPVTFGICMED